MNNGSDISGDGGVFKEVIKEAETDAIWPTDDTPVVDVCCVGYLVGKCQAFYDSLRDESNGILTFETRMGSVISGLDRAIQCMKVGEIAEVTCMPEYTHGSIGSLSEIPRDVTLIFYVELVACSPRMYDFPCSPSRRQILKEREERYKELMNEREEADKRKREAEVIGGVYDLTGDGGVLKKIIRKAEANAIGPTHSSVVDVWYNGYIVQLETGEIFNFTREDEADMEDDTNLKYAAILTFKHNAGFVMLGWHIALKDMKVGDIATITCKPDYAYGKVGRPPEIPPNATVTSTLKLVKCKPWLWWENHPPVINAKVLKEFRMLTESTEASGEEEEYDTAAADITAAAAAAAAWHAKKVTAAAALLEAKLNELKSIFLADGEVLQLQNIESR